MRSDHTRPFRRRADARLKRWWFYARVLLALAIAAAWFYREWSRPAPAPRRDGAVRAARVRVPVDPRDVWVDDGDTIRIKWPDAPPERVRILGIDAPEVANARYPGRRGQDHGEESRTFARRRILAAGRLELLRAPRPDRYGRTLGYLFVDGSNFSVLSIENHMAESTVDRFGDNGFPDEAAQVREAARKAGPPPFESPRAFRDRTAARKAG